MQIIKYLCLVLLIVPLYSCSKDKINTSVIKENDLESQVLEAYKEGLKSLKEGDAIFASKKFNEAETLFPQSKWAPRSSLMAAYSYYSQDYYEDSILELERFLEIYPFHENIDYAYYLLGLCWYEQIIDEKKDLQTIIKAKEKFSYLIKNFPNTEYALDAEFKIDLINDTLAAKEMYVGRYYFNQKKWIPAINRFRIIVDDYETTIYTEEALHRLVEVYYTIGLKDEAKKYATILGYNYQSSQWYEKSYSVFDKMYEKNKKKMINQNKKKERSILKKFKSLLN